MAVIELNQVRKVYTIDAQVVEALRGVDLTIDRGKVVAITGKSGAGKSTLLHIIGTLDKPSTGTVCINGTDVSTMSDQATSSFRNCTVGFVFQTNNLLPEFSAIENVMLPGLISGANRQEVRQRAAELLSRVELAHRENHRPGELSGGEQQRVAIARALLMAPPIILADEPTGNLDKKTSHAVQELLFSLCEHHQTTMLLVTHDPELARKLPGSVYMEDGRVVETGGLV